MLKAWNKTEDRFVLGKSIVDNKHVFVCPRCDSRVFFVDPENKVKHFRHSAGAVCEGQPYNKIHDEMEELIVDRYRLTPEQVEVNLGYVVPDIYKETPEGYKVAIELVSAPITETYFMDMTDLYTQNDIYVLWIFDEELFKPRIGQPVPELWQKVQEMFFGRIYFYREQKEEGSYRKAVVPKRFTWKKDRLSGWVKSYKQVLEGFPVNFEARLRASVNICNGSYSYVLRFSDSEFWSKHAGSR